jgi:hypothetical protein
MFTGNENHSIPLQDAAALTLAYRNLQPANCILGEYFGKQAILDILNQKDCVGMRVYYGSKVVDNVNQPCLILVGVTADGNDMTDGLLAEMGYTCPTFCSVNNPLNS